MKQKKPKTVKHDKHVGKANCLFCGESTWRCGLCQAVHLKECRKVKYNE